MILQNCCPPLVQVAKLGGACSQAYAVLWESAYKDVRRDPRLHKHWKTRMDCGGTTKWTIKGIAGELGTCRKRVAKALDQLLDNGFVIAEGYEQTGRGTKTIIWPLFILTSWKPVAQPLRSWVLNPQRHAKFFLITRLSHQSSTMSRRMPKEGLHREFWR